MFDEYIRDEVVPFIHASCQTAGIPITTMGASLGGYHAANTLFRYPHMFKRCYALSGVYDLRRYMGGMYDENFYFHNPVDYLANLSDPWIMGQLAYVRDPSGHRNRSVGEQRLYLRDVGDPGAERDQPSSR